MKIRIGIIAEDNSDVEVISEILKKMRQNDEISIKKFVGHGCGRIVGKCCQWANQLFLYGCKYLLVIHDLDERDINELRTDINHAINSSSIRRKIVVIPIREIEAWLLCDGEAIRKSMGIRNKISDTANPQLIIDPKRKLGEIIYLKSEKRKRYIVNDNVRIASRINVKKLLRCNSFIPLYNFIVSI
jgi:hypothetical protein